MPERVFALFYSVVTAKDTHHPPSPGSAFDSICHGGGGGRGVGFCHQRSPRGGTIVIVEFNVTLNTDCLPQVTMLWIY